MRVGQWQLSHALFGAVPRSSLMHTAVLGLAYAHNTTFPSPSPIANKAHRKAPHPSPPPPPTNTTPAALPPKPLSTCPPHSSCTPPLLDQILEADRTAEDKWALCMDGEAGALVLGGGDRTLCVDGKVDGTVPLLRPRGGSHEGQQYWVRVRGLRLGEVGVAPELFHNAEGEEDDEGCANATTVSNLPGAVKNGTLTGMVRPPVCWLRGAGGGVGWSRLLGAFVGSFPWSLVCVCLLLLSGPFADLSPPFSASPLCALAAERRPPPPVTLGRGDPRSDRQWEWRLGPARPSLRRPEAAL